jgi:hypothetical protein
MRPSLLPAGGAWGERACWTRVAAGCSSRPRAVARSSRPARGGASCDERMGGKPVTCPVGPSPGTALRFALPIHFNAACDPAPQHTCIQSGQCPLCLAATAAHGCESGFPAATHVPPRCALCVDVSFRGPRHQSLLRCHYLPIPDVVLSRLNLGPNARGPFPPKRIAPHQPSAELAAHSAQSTTPPDCASSSQA